LLDAVFADARVEPAPALVREGLVVVPTGDAVLRCAVGPGRRELVSQQRALAALSSLQPPDEVRTLVPWLERSGRTGLADWTVEPRLPGAVRGDLPQRARQRCLDVLAGLRALDAGNATSAATDARAIVALVPTAGLEALGASVDAALVDHPRSFAHGDFWAGNVLVDGEGDVRGIIDWASAGPGRPALLDLLHLLLISERRPPGHAWGPAIVETLLPLARTEDETVASFARRVGVELDARRFLALVGAYWLDRLRYQLESFGDRVERPTWLRNNLTLVLRELAPLV
jgi:aminoglycoside phosphotransferase (APT) family kinase protein